VNNDAGQEGFGDPTPEEVQPHQPVPAPEQGAGAFPHAAAPTGEVPVFGPPTAEVPVFGTPTGEVPPTGQPVGASVPPQAPPPPPPAPPWAHAPAGGQAPGSYWMPGSPPPNVPPQYPYAGHYPYGSTPPFYAPAPKRKPLVNWLIVAVVALVVIGSSAVVGGAVEHAADHNGTGFSPSITSPSQGSDGFGPGSGLGSNSGTGGGTGSNNAPAGLNTAAIAAQVDPALVDIDTTLAQGGAAAGTGMVISSSGLVLTNNHVIENATTINVQVVGGSRTYSATVLGYSVTDDVALLQLQNASGLKAVSTGNSSNLSTSQPVVAIGNAGGTGGTPSAVGGTITALNQTITAGDAGTLSETLHGLIETNANIQPGDSGGALVNTSGKVIGMNTAAAQSNGSSINQGYAIPINKAITIANQIKAGHASSTVQIGPRALLGVEVTDPSQGGGNGFFGGSGSGSTVAGALVAGVQSGSAADNAGIGTGDTIVAINGTAITSAEGLTTALLDHKPGDTVTVGWVDAEGANHSAAVQLTTGPPA
jgi:S1-C subfamily serine protease